MLHFLLYLVNMYIIGSLDVKKVKGGAYNRCKKSEHFYVILLQIPKIMEKI